MDLTFPYTTLPSPVGDLALFVDDFGALVRIAFLDVTSFEELRESPLFRDRALREDPRACSAPRAQLMDYFAGKRRDFTLDLAPEGSAFQQRVWRELRRVPFGSTVGYGELARRMDGQSGSRASRAVGHANHVNPVPIVIPCHRVIGSDGGLVGFGAGLSIKRALLDHERGQAVLWS